MLDRRLSFLSARRGKATTGTHREGQGGAAVASQSRYDEAMSAVVEKADVDWSRPVKERVQFDRDTLGRLIRLYKESGGSDKTKAAYRQQYKAAGKHLQTVGEDNPLDAMTPMLVVIHLKERLTGSADKRYEDTPNGPRLRADAPREDNDAIREDLSWTEEPGEY